MGCKTHTNYEVNTTVDLFLINFLFSSQQNEFLGGTLDTLIRHLTTVQGIVLQLLSLCLYSDR